MSFVKIPYIIYNYVFISHIFQNNLLTKSANLLSYFLPIITLVFYKILRELISWDPHQDYGIRTIVAVIRFDLLDIKLCTFV
jgi:hypothetical protein